MSSTASSCRKKWRRSGAGFQPASPNSQFTSCNSQFAIVGPEICAGSIANCELIVANCKVRQKQSRSGPVSRVLSPPVQKAWAEDGHFSRTPVTRRLQQPTRASGGGPDQPARYSTPVREALPKETSTDALLGLAPGGVCQASRVAPAAGALLPHRFTLTAPRDKTGAHARRAAVCFLLHFPEPCGRSPLATTLSSGARTFLSRVGQTSCLPIDSWHAIWQAGCLPHAAATVRPAPRL
jgi:hypothetical protein